MTTSPLRRAALASALALALTSCFAQVEAPEVSLSRTLCPLSGPGCLPGGGAPLGAIAPAGATSFEVDLGPLSPPASSSSGPIKLRNTLRLQGVTVAVVGTPGANLAGVTRLELLQATPADPTCAQPSACRVMARYDRGPGAAAGTSIHLAPGGDGLLEVAGGEKRLVLLLRGAGTAPAPATWNAEVSLDLAVKMRASAP